jgi:hypothetical protein
VEKIEAVCPEVIVRHTSTNSIRCGTSATEIMGDTVDLIGCMRNPVTTVKIVVIGVLNQRDVSEQFTRRINTELGWLYSVCDCLMVDINCWIGTFNMARYGMHLNRTELQIFSKLLCKVIRSCLQGNVQPNWWKKLVKSTIGDCVKILLKWVTYDATKNN